MVDVIVSYFNFRKPSISEFESFSFSPRIASQNFFKSSSMAANSHRGGSFYGGAAAYRSREGLSTRPAVSSDEIQLRIDPVHADFDDEITSLRSQVKQLRNVAEEIGTEAKFQKDFLDQLTVIGKLRS